jgi:signal peptidase I
MRQLVEFVLTIAVAFLLAQGVRTWVVQPYTVPTGSMLPTIQLNDLLLANKFTYYFSTPKTGQIVVFDNPIPGHPATEDTLIKRVIAVGGQTVDLEGGKVVVDGKPLTEPYTYGQPSDPLGGSRITFPLTVPRGQPLVRTGAGQLCPRSGVLHLLAAEPFRPAEVATGPPRRPSTKPALPASECAAILSTRVETAGADGRRT